MKRWTKGYCRAVSPVVLISFSPFLFIFWPSWCPLAWGGKQGKTSLNGICDARVISFPFFLSFFSCFHFFVPKVEMWSDGWANGTGACLQVLYPEATAMKKKSNQNRTYHIQRWTKCSRSSPPIQLMAMIGKG
ncbi:hypothetical protein HOY80DRAFT_401129 [Tuber brumale]|nr:hypothetical protein HOY80DRAFT_401129 [Tuber brumale]